MSSPATQPGLRHDPIDAELETILTSFDTSYVWRYGSLKDGLRDLYEKAKREQWNASVLDWGIQVDPEDPIIPAQFNPLEDYAPYKRLSDKEKREFNHAQICLLYTSPSPRDS